MVLLLISSALALAHRCEADATGGPAERGLQGVMSYQQGVMSYQEGRHGQFRHREAEVGSVSPTAPVRESEAAKDMTHLCRRIRAPDGTRHLVRHHYLQIPLAIPKRGYYNGPFDTSMSSLVYRCGQGA